MFQALESLGCVNYYKLFQYNLKFKDFWSIIDHIKTSSIYLVNPDLGIKQLVSKIITYIASTCNSLLELSKSVNYIAIYAWFGKYLLNEKQIILPVICYFINASEKLLSSTNPLTKLGIDEVQLFSWLDKWLYHTNSGEWLVYKVNQWILYQSRRQCLFQSIAKYYIKKLYGYGIVQHSGD